MHIKEYFKKAIDEKASDLHLVGGSIPTIRIDGELVKLSKEKLDSNELERQLKELIGEKSERWDIFQIKHELDFSFELNNFRFRINLHYQEGVIGMTARLIPKYIPRPEVIGFDEVIYKLTHLRDGLILVTGPSGSGKSTTLAAMINIINSERRAHIITIEDPIEYYFEENQSIIEQRELGSDTFCFSEALKYALRQDPNVIMVGEMRDLETISAVITAAETGHLVLSTLHTYSAVETINRIVSIFPSHQQQEILNQLSDVLRAVIAQDLLPRIGGGMIVAREIMINNAGIANLIRRNQANQIYSMIQTGKKEGMITMNKALENLYRKGKISEDTYLNRLRDMETKTSFY